MNLLRKSLKSVEDDLFVVLFGFSMKITGSPSSKYKIPSLYMSASFFFKHFVLFIHEYMLVVR